jgi:hypothetical protein
VRVAGLTFRAYCYNAAAENTQMRHIAADVGMEDEVAAFTGSGNGWTCSACSKPSWSPGHRVTGRTEERGPAVRFSWDAEAPRGR